MFNETATFSCRQAASLAGFRTAMMVHYLARSGVLVPSIRPPSGRGRRRLYSFGDVVMLRALSRLLSLGLPVSRLKRALTTYKKLYSGITPDSAMLKYFMTDGNRVLFKASPDAFVDLTGDGQLTFAFVVDMEHARTEVVHALGKKVA